MNAQYTTVSAQNTTLNSAQPDLPLSVTNEVEVTSIVTYIPFSKVKYTWETRPSESGIL